MGRRVDLTALGAKAAAPATETGAPTPDPAPAPVEAPTPARAPRATERARPPRKRKTKAAGEWVRYDEYERKETRLRADQYEELGNVSRRLNRERNRDGERITENTLIRVAIDLLLERDGDLAGKTESELRKSVGL